MIVYTAEQLRAVGRRIFAAAGAPDDIATHVAGSLVQSNLAGHDSHGVIRIPAYVQAIQRGHLIPGARPSIERETPTTAVVLGNWAFGQVAATYATELAIAKAKESHVGAVGVAQCNHIGRLGEYAETVARAGMVSMITVGGYPSGTSAPYGGAARVLGTNPFAFGVPAGESAPLIADFATTIVAEGKLQVLRSKGEPAPAGWILDKEGKPTTSVEDFYSGGMLQPFGGHKGYALSMVAEVFSGAIAGVDAHRDDHGGSGTFILVFDPAAFRPFAEFAGSVESLFGKVKSVPTAPGFDEVFVPGEPEQRSRTRRSAEGVPVPDQLRDRLIATAKELGTSADELES